MTRHRHRPALLVVLALALAAIGLSSAGGQRATAADQPAGGKKPLRVAYSDWPGWVAFEVGIQKGWFKEEGVDVQFSWFDYLPSMDAFSAGKVDHNPSPLAHAMSAARSQATRVPLPPGWRKPGRV